VQDQGRLLTTIDPTGGRVSFWEAHDNRGFTRVREPGAPAWFELWTNNYETAVEYYRDVAGWDPHDLPNDMGWRYTTHGKGDDAYAGIYDATAELGEHGTPTWVVYFGTDDVDASLVRARALGVTVHEVPKETPYGRLVGVQDPNDTWFQLISV
jgi:predicted enzyme related to lactoylglutathione lyase